MAYTAKLLSIMAVGIFLGILIDKDEKNTKRTWKWLSGLSGKVQSFVVVYLIFILGVRIGSDQQVFEQLGQLWIVALVITAAAMGAGLVLIHLLRKALKFDKEGVRMDD